MKLAVLSVALAMAAAAPMPQSRPQPGPFPSSIKNSFFQYLNKYKSIFKNRANHKDLQDIFTGPDMKNMLLSLLHKRPPMAHSPSLRTNWRDQDWTRDEFMAWYPSLQALFGRFRGEAPAIPEEWRVADTDGSGFITPTKIWTMLRDTTDNPFFNSFIALLYNEHQKQIRFPRVFFNKAKRDSFEDAFNGVWGRIAGLDDRRAGSISADDAGEEEETITVVPEGTDDPVEIPVESVEGEKAGTGEPFVPAGEQVMAMNGQMMLASDMVAAGMPAMPNMPLNVTMPNGQEVPMTTAAGSADFDDGAQPKAKIQTASGQAMDMPVAAMETDGATSKTTIMNDDGGVVELEAPMPEPIDPAAGDDAGFSKQTPAELTDVKTGAKAEGTLTPLADEGLTAEVCDGEEQCMAASFETPGMQVILPMKTLDMAADEMPAEGGEVTLTVTNQATGESTILKPAVITKNPATGDVTVAAVSPDQKSVLKMEIPAEGIKTDAEDPTFAGQEAPEGTVEIDNMDGDPLAIGEITNATLAEDPVTGEEAAIVETTLAGTPTAIKMEGDLKGLGLDEPKENVTKITLSMDGQEIELVKVGETENEVTGMTPDGQLQVTVPKEDVATTDDSDPNTTKDIIDMETAAGGAEEVPIAAVQKDGRGGEELVGTTTDGKLVDVKVETA